VTAAATEPYYETYRGMRVPWVAQWTDELGKDPIQRWQYGTSTGIAYADEKPEDRELGVLWMRTDTSRGGTPQFAQLNVWRQRRCMIDGLCQVCGQSAEGSWLIPRVEGRPNGRPMTIATPPTCAPCIEEARKVCPHLRAHGQGTRLLVRNYRPLAVFGDLVTMLNSKVIHTKGELLLSDPDVKTRVLGRQLTVELWDYRRLRD
jgi:hypothetical protein